MSAKKPSAVRIVIIFCATVFISLMVMIVTLLSLSPFQYRLACQVQVAVDKWIGLPEGFHTWPIYEDEHYTGTARIWDSAGTLRIESSYEDGLRNGVWREFEEDGSLKSMCEYRSGRPWNGVCQFFEEKAWIAEYRNGEPYNGVVEENEEEKCYVDGRVVSPEEFMRIHKISLERKDELYGIDVFDESQWKMQSRPVSGIAQP